MNLTEKEKDFLVILKEVCRKILRSNHLCLKSICHAKLKCFDSYYGKIPYDWQNQTNSIVDFITTEIIWGENGLIDKNYKKAKKRSQKSK